jgi:ABC-type transport system involved in cytochrome c biogenesis permease subunit
MEALNELGELSSWLLLAAAVFYILAIGENARARLYFQAGIGVHVANFIKRGYDLGWIPLAEKHDTISLLALSIALVTYYLVRAEKNDRVLLYGAPLAVVFVFISFLTRRIDGISPFLQTPWFFLHMLTYFLSFGFLAAGSCLGIMYLTGGDERLEAVQYRVMVHGWIVFTISLVLGSIWFFIAYGTYWLWTSKELWSTLTWFYLGMYLHARLMRGWRGRPAAIMGIAGFAFAVFTYFGVGTIIPSPPTLF